MKCRCRGFLGGDARDAVAPLLKLLRTSEFGVYVVVGRALKQIDADAAARAGVR